MKFGFWVRSFAGAKQERKIRISLKDCILGVFGFTLLCSIRVARKPSSVVDGYLSRRIVANTLKPPFEVMCRANNPSVGVAADGVYMAAGVSICSVGSYPAFPSLPTK